MGYDDDEMVVPITGEVQLIYQLIYCRKLWRPTAKGCSKYRFFERAQIKRNNNDRHIASQRTKHRKFEVVSPMNAEYNIQKEEKKYEKGPHPCSQFDKKWHVLIRYITMIIIIKGIQVSVAEQCIQ